MVNQNRIAVIPARGGSKRLPGKNTAPFMGRPMIGWTISAAVDTGLFDRIVVSTDSPGIAEVARECGVEVPVRRDRSADDFAPVSVATTREIEQAEAHFDESYRTVCQLMPNCPLRTAEDIVDAIQAFEQSGEEFQISCFKYGWMNPWWAVRLDNESRPERLFPETLNQRSQDLDSVYCPTGAIWLARVVPLQEAGTFYGPGHRFHPLDWKSAVDIDDAEDLEMAIAVATLRARS